MKTYKKELLNEAANQLPPPAMPAFKEVLLFWLKLGFISFGGPAGQIAIMHEFVVEKKRWLSDAKFLHALNYCMLLPGPEAQQLATYIGWLLHGVRGGLAAGILFVLPSVFILLGLSMAYVSYGSIPWVSALFYGLKPAVVAIVLLALLKIGKKSLKSVLHYLLALASFLAIYFLNIPFPYIIICAILLAVLARQLFPKLLHPEAQPYTVAGDVEASAYLVQGTTGETEVLLKPMQLLWRGVMVVVLWLSPFLLFYLFSQDFIFWKTLSFFFTKAALVTFGGAYAVLPYVAQVAVEDFNWLSRLQMIDGLSLGETTPGPLIMVLVFVGFMAGYNQYGGSLLMGAVGLATTTFFTFLPCFLFILVGGPLIERTQHNTWVKSILGVVTAAVVGVVLNLAVYFGSAVVLRQGREPDWLALAWVLVSVLAMYRFKIGMITWIAISAVAGLAAYLVQLLPG
ncbi:chromate efflux transporter [Pontibacter qinzhouensis]|uniref:Chromate efflux transporter n=1 Tax=Pontibacter qinzhouensis TaxID=2603253 RepID=A0A5C8KBN2_9BACT|nr:chromate efflux transporter [Pontibacter qinzhouensis]TXK49253.1 chromate efflux transporter [Pontibacter qinzhouensis]